MHCCAGSPAGGNMLPDVAGGSAGQAVVAWYTSASPYQSPHAAWNVVVARIRAGRPERPRVLPSSPVRVGAICGTSTCSGDTRDLLDFLTVTTSPLGQAAVVWCSDRGGTIRDWYARVP